MDLRINLGIRILRLKHIIYNAFCAIIQTSLPQCVYYNPPICVMFICCKIKTNQT